MRDSSERRKKPRRVGSGVERVETTETEETVMVAWPVWVKPKRSKRIIGRESEVMVRVLISAVVEGMKVRTTGTRKRKMNIRGSFAISWGCGVGVTVGVGSSVEESNGDGDGAAT